MNLMVKRYMGQDTVSTLNIASPREGRIEKKSQVIRDWGDGRTIHGNGKHKEKLVWLRRLNSVLNSLS